jgi:hypothetical protein
MHAIVEEYQHISDARIAYIVTIMAVILGVSCFVFFLELFFIVPRLILALSEASSKLNAGKAEAETTEWKASAKKYAKMKKSIMLF